MHTIYIQHGHYSIFTPFHKNSHQYRSSACWCEIIPQWFQTFHFFFYYFTAFSLSGVLRHWWHSQNLTDASWVGYLTSALQTVLSEITWGGTFFFSQISALLQSACAKWGTQHHLWAGRNEGRSQPVMASYTLSRTAHALYDIQMICIEDLREKVFFPAG